MPMGRNMIRSLQAQILRSSLFLNGMNLILSTVSTSFFGFIGWLVAARFFPPDNIGIASTLISSATLIATVSLLGFNISIIRYLPQMEYKNNTINSCFSLSLLTSIIISIVFICGINIWVPKLLFVKDSFLYMALFILFTGTLTISSLLSSVFISNRASKFVLLKDSIFALSKIPIPLLLVSLGGFGIFCGWTIAEIISLCIGFIFLHSSLKEYRPRICFDKAVVVPMVNYSLWNYISHLLYTAPSLTVPLIITSILSPAMTAYFYIAWMIGNLFFAIPLQFSQSLLAEGSNQMNCNKDTVTRSFGFCMLLLIPSILVIFLVGEFILSLFGPEYASEALPLLKILAVSSIFLTVNIIFISVKRIKHEMAMVILIFSTITLITLGGTIILLEPVGLVGVGYSWMAGNFVGILEIGAYILKRTALRCDRRGRG